MFELSLAPPFFLFFFALRNFHGCGATHWLWLYSSSSCVLLTRQPGPLRVRTPRHNSPISKRRARSPQSTRSCTDPTTPPYITYLVTRRVSSIACRDSYGQSLRRALGRWR
ncbi:hypothetical protein BD413DRAFT_587731 [Trametes elegans]|nr:hypothetical protein BD413DRAFT_587731 [Trametes elegans]